MQQPSKDEWVLRLRSEDSQNRDTAIDELRTILSRALGRTLTQRYGTELAVEDIVQEALVKILDSLDKFEGRSRFLTWAISLATRLGLTELRRRRYRDVSLDGKQGETLSESLADETESSESGLERQRILTTLASVIQESLTEKQRIAIQATLDGVPVEEVAASMGSNRNAVYKLEHDARMKLRKALESHGINADDVRQVIA